MTVYGEKSIKEQQGSLDEIMRAFLPHVSYTGTSDWKGEISAGEAILALNFLKARCCIEDALTLLNDKVSLRESVSYRIANSGPAGDMTFEVLNTEFKEPCPNGILGRLYTYDKMGNPVLQLAVSRLAIGEAR